MHVIVWETKNICIHVTTMNKNNNDKTTSSVKMTGETPVVRSVKRKPRDDRQKYVDIMDLIDIMDLKDIMDLIDK